MAGRYASISQHACFSGRKFRVKDTYKAASQAVDRPMRNGVNLLWQRWDAHGELTDRTGI